MRQRQFLSEEQSLHTLLRNQRSSTFREEHQILEKHAVFGNVRTFALIQNNIFVEIILSVHDPLVERDLLVHDTGLKKFNSWHRKPNPCVCLIHLSGI